MGHDRIGIGKGLLIATGIAVAAAFAWPATGQGANTPSTRPPAGYLARTALDDKVFLPPPPTEESAEDKRDLAIFRATRSLQGSDRWQLAVRDAATDPASMLAGFGCALGAKLRPDDVPAVNTLMRHAAADALSLIGPPKNRYQRPRPFLRTEGPVCTPLTPAFSRSGSYPSGHSTVGWTYALILTELAPDRASELLARGRTFGESRVVCGVHYASDVAAGQTIAAGLVATLNADPRFKTDLAAAKAELDEVRHRAPPPDSTECTIETKASANRPW